VAISPLATRQRVAGFRLKPGLAAQGIDFHAAKSAAPNQHDEPLRGLTRRELGEIAPDFGVAAAPMRRRHVENDSAANRAARRGIAREAARDEAIARSECDRVTVDVEARESDFTGPQRFVTDGCEPSPALRGSGQEFDRRLVLDRRCDGEPRDLDVRNDGRPQQPGRRDDLAARDFVEFDALEIDRAAQPGRAALDGNAVTLQAANAAAPPRWLDLDGIADRKRTADEGSSHHAAKTLCRKTAVDAQAGRARTRCAGLRGFDRLADRGAQFRNPLAGQRRNGHHGRIDQRRIGEERGDLLPGERCEIGLGGIDLGQGHDPAIDPEQFTDCDVFARLGHHAFVGRDDEQHEIDPRSPRHHGSDEPFVTGHVDDTHAAAVVEVEGRKAQADGDPAGLLLGESVGLDPGERANQRRLAVIDVTRGAGGTAIAVPFRVWTNSFFLTSARRKRVLSRRAW